MNIKTIVLLLPPSKGRCCCCWLLNFMSRKISIHSKPNTDSAWIFSRFEMKMRPYSPHDWIRFGSYNCQRFKLLAMVFSSRFCSIFSFPQDLTCSQRDVKGLLHHEDDIGNSCNCLTTKLPLFFLRISGLLLLLHQRNLMLWALWNPLTSYTITFPRYVSKLYCLSRSSLYHHYI